MTARCPDRGGREKGHRPCIADVLRAGLPQLSRRLPAHHWKTLNALLCCRTERLGGHLYRCQDCGGEHFIAHSCRNRHCPNCQKRAAAGWLEKQEASLLPVPYFHIVFTLPHELNPLIAQNRKALYTLLFCAASATLLKFGQARLKAQIVVTAVLHTWSQTLLDHYHLHCIVTGGGLAPTGWRHANQRYLFPVKALSKVFRAKFRDGLQRLHAGGTLLFHGQMQAMAQPDAFGSLLARVLSPDWNVHVKRPFGGPKAVLAYLSRYTHRVAIGNGRILRLDPQAGRVTFAYKDYADKARRKTMTLDVEEFIRRFCLHILPARFVKIRHGACPERSRRRLLGNHKRREKIEKARASLGCDPAGCDALCQSPESTSHERIETPEPPPLVCPHCGSRNLLFVERRKRPINTTPPCDSS